MEFNSVLFILVGCSLIAMAIFFERIFFLRKSEVDTNQFLISIRKVIEERNIIEGVQICETTGGSVAAIVRSGLTQHARTKEDIIRSMEVSGLNEIAKLEKNARILSIIAHIAPLIGLLGTVLGFIQAFGEMRISGMMDISTSRVGEAMEYALVTTAAGLVVAIPATIAYNYIVSRIKGIVLEIQTVSSEVVDLLTHEI
ncbi:MAG: Tol-Pal system protein TolQ [Chlamydiales bacterium]|nr:Tol-Pal system protein TolQ [Chlamydiales bacterium]MCH9619822.1 Tol-Pal system protein TolQ [Chlamydiales bacterium]MCH9622751.1 Tol-Pal system protein TolQ [Chlamydiales bacterium]